MQKDILRASAFWVLAALVWTAPPARAAECGESSKGFRAWLDDFRQVAINDGVSPDVVEQTLATASFNRSVLAHDQGQGALQGNYGSFAAGHITPARIKHGKTMMLAYAERLERIEQRFGVAAPVLVAIWGLETAAPESSARPHSTQRPAASRAGSGNSPWMRARPHRWP
jgi:membrane-bound lytic murein transglycosylase B